MIDLVIKYVPIAHCSPECKKLLLTYYNCLSDKEFEILCIKLKEAKLYERFEEIVSG